MSTSDIEDRIRVLTEMEANLLRLRWMLAGGDEEDGKIMLSEDAGDVSELTWGYRANNAAKTFASARKQTARQRIIGLRDKYIGMCELEGRQVLSDERWRGAMRKSEPSFGDLENQARLEAIQGTPENAQATRILNEQAASQTAVHLSEAAIAEKRRPHSTPHLTWPSTKTRKN